MIFDLFHFLPLKSVQIEDKMKWNAQREYAGKVNKKQKKERLRKKK